MKIGIIVDGDAEMKAFQCLTRRIKIQGVQLLKPIHADMQPKATAGQIAKAAEDKLGLLHARRADRIIVLIDRENRQACPGQWKDEIERAISKLGYSQVRVVIKNRKFENWLIADVRVFEKLRARYQVTGILIAPDKADDVEDAEKLLNKIAVKVEYRKGRDAAQITALQDYLEVGRNSRSFRRFLRLIGHPHYRDQSKKPFPKGKKNG